MGDRDRIIAASYGARPQITSAGFNLNSAVKQDENGADTAKHKGF